PVRHTMRSPRPHTLSARQLVAGRCLEQRSRSVNTRQRRPVRGSMCWHCPTYRSSRSGAGPSIVNSVVTLPPSTAAPARAAAAAKQREPIGPRSSACARSCSTLVRLGDLYQRLACHFFLGPQRVQLVEVNVLL